MKGKAEMGGKSKFKLVCCESTPLAMAAEKLPERFQILKWGENENTNGIRVFVGEALIKNMADPLYPWDVVALDYEHNTVPEHPKYLESQEPRQVAGFGPVEVVRGEGVFMRVGRWTPTGLTEAWNFNDVSAAPVRDENGVVVGVHSVALCRNGAVPEMGFFEAALSVDEHSVFAALSVNTKKEKAMMDFRALLIATLGKDPEIGDEELKAAVIAALKPKEEKGVDPDALSVAIDRALAGKVDPLKQKVDALSVLNDGFQKELARRDKQALVDSAGREGKVVGLSADVLAGMTVAQVKEHCAGLSVTVPMDGRNGGADVGGGAKGPTAQQRHVASQIGVDADKVFGSSAE